ncbi:MAG: hypothetical protein EKK40_05500 [Bradyrhizobiaceae bacterium]|nr:MAG: hypothetical protein EKK40_05500 [Bradyrhizobiaceae bacterium]
MINNSTVSVSIGLITKAFTSQHYPTLFESAETHDAARDLIAQLVPYTQDVDLLLAIVRSGLPADYTGNTLDEVPDMVRGALKKGFAENDAIDPNKSIASAVVGLALTQALDLFHDEDGNAFVTIPKGSGGRQHLNLNKQSAASWLSSIWYRTTDNALQDQPRSTALATLAAKAKYDGQIHRVSLRLARFGNAMFFDLGDDDGSMVQIDANGWQIVKDAPVKFVRPASFKALPLPEAGGDLNELKSLLKISDNSWPLVLAFLISAFRPEGPYFCLLVDGEQGSGKSFLCSMLKAILDPSRFEKLPLPSTDSELFIAAKDSHLLVFDNASGVRFDMSDALCRLATGASLARRRLYTDDDVHVITQCKPFIINGIGDFADRPDLLERAMLISLEGLKEEDRLSESQILMDFAKLLPRVLGRLFDVVACAFNNEHCINAPTNLRMADGARWLKAAEPATGLPPNSIISAIVESQNASVIDRMRNRTLFRVLEKLVATGPFEGQIAHLFDQLLIENDKLDRSFPRTAAHLSNELRRHRQAMAKAGLMVELQPRGRTGRRVKIWLKDVSLPPEKPKPNY